MCGLLIIGIMPLIGQLNNMVTGLGKPGPNGVICICKRAMCGSALESRHFFSVSFTNFIHASTCPLLWWWYNEKYACSMFRLLQNVLNLSEMKLPPESDIIFFGSPYSAKITLHDSIRSSADKSSVF